MSLAVPTASSLRTAAAWTQSSTSENGADLIDLTGFAGIDDFGEVDAQQRAVGADTVIDLGAAAGREAGSHTFS